MPSYKDMRVYIVSLGLALLLLCSSCGALGNLYTYTGEKLPATTSVKTYYAAKDIKQEYRVIGHLAYPITAIGDQNEVQNKMIEKAKAVGADGIIFLGMSPKETYQLADVIKF